jgi:uncharacterized protein (DUF362 family)/Pyruvate/2-oxoacid:ferredoxin oxidoreductase delta subunit
MNEVYVVKCPDYDHVEEKMKELLAMMGGMSQFAKPGEKIVLKVNLLGAAKPEKAVTTHPAVVTAVARMAKSEGSSPVIADSPGSGYPYNEKTLDRVYRTCGMYKAAEESGIEVNLDTTYQIVSFPDGKLIKRFEVITPVIETDVVFNLCKFKTHGFLNMTGAVKNSFGVIPGLTKPGYHAKLQDKHHFASMCLDLSAYVSPRISIMDAVIGMEGNGPHAGAPRHIGLLAASTNPLALDIVAGEIMGLDRKNNPVLIEAEKRGISPNRLEQVEIIGADIADLRVADFKLPSTVLGGAGSSLLSLLAPVFKSGFTVRPQIIESKCIACGICRDACPMKVISIVNKHAQIDNRNCIRCYCCHEMCPHHAIELKQGVLYCLFNR